MYYNSDSWIFSDGEWVKPEETTAHIYGQSLHYGNAVFEGIRSYETDKGFQVFKAKEHYERLIYSAETMYLPLEYSVSEMIDINDELLKKNNLKNAYIRPLVYSNPSMGLTPTGKSHFFMAAWEWGKFFSDGLSVMTSSYQRPNPKSTHIDAKISGHYVNSILASKEAQSKGFGEALLLDQDGFVAEGPGANFFYQKDHTLFTAPLGNILPGITRQTILDLAQENGIEVNEVHFKPEKVHEADAAFFVGTAAEVTHIKSLDETVFPLSWEDSFGFQLAQAYSKLVRTHKD